MSIFHYFRWDKPYHTSCGWGLVGVCGIYAAMVAGLGLLALIDGNWLAAVAMGACFLMVLWSGFSSYQTTMRWRAANKAERAHYQRLREKFPLMYQ
jgi:uncharacterized membrane protein YccC